MGRLLWGRESFSSDFVSGALFTPARSRLPPAATSAATARGVRRRPAVAARRASRTLAAAQDSAQPQWARLLAHAPVVVAVVLRRELSLARSPSPGAAQVQAPVLLLVQQQWPMPEQTRGAPPPLAQASVPRQRRQAPAPEPEQA